MKKLPVLFLCTVACIITFISCLHHRHDLSLIFSNSKQYYSMNASYDQEQTRDVERYMDSKPGRQSNMSFANSKIDGTLTLDDHTTIYMKKTPGVLKIELDKNDNSDESLQRVKAICEGLKGVLAK